jgi:enoyl-CoA hydratase/carnithine racemase
VGYWWALPGDPSGGADAIAYQLADGCLPSDRQAAVWEALATQSFADGAAIKNYIASQFVAAQASGRGAQADIDQHFSLPTVGEIVRALEGADSDWALATAAAMRKRSPLMLHVVLEQIRRARSMGLADDLRMERDMVRHCFYLRPGQSETLEGIRALALDKDHAPKWNPACIENVTPDMVAPFFASPWSAHSHPLAALA